METYIFFLIFLASFIISSSLFTSLLNVLLTYITLENNYVGVMCFSICFTLNQNKTRDLIARVQKYQTLSIEILLRAQKTLQSNKEELDDIQKEVENLKSSN